MIKNKVIVTGGLGYIGSHTAVELSDKFQVVLVDNSTAVCEPMYPKPPVTIILFFIILLKNRNRKYTKN